MDEQKKQSYRAFCQEQARKIPDYSIGALAGMWAKDIIRDRINTGSPPGVIETKEINKQCIGRIYAAVESGELEAKYLEDDLITGSFTGEVIKVPVCWIVETKNYIDWAKDNEAGPAELIDDIIEEVASDTPTTSNNTQPSASSDLDDKPLDERERKTLLAIIAALCKKQGISPCDRGLASELEEITAALEEKRSAKAIKKHLDRAGLLF